MTDHKSSLMELERDSTRLANELLDVLRKEFGIVPVGAQIAALCLAVQFLIEKNAVTPRPVGIVALSAGIKIALAELRKTSEGMLARAEPGSERVQ